MGYMLVDDKPLYEAVSGAARNLSEVSFAMVQGRERDPAQSRALAARLRTLADDLEADASAPVVIDASE